ncbi:hypothetical protein CBS101457_000241 [Exobasidium rhododendri]|nr:hypothetical protein CBS101457_000241 [Exobasidium rhododendri]
MRRGLLDSTVKPVLQAQLTARIERYLLSKKPARVDQALQVLFPLKPHTKLPMWSKGMPEEASEYLVQRVVHATGDSADVVRNSFLRLRLEPDLAHALVYAEDHDLNQWIMHPTTYVLPGHVKDEYYHRPQASKECASHDEDDDEEEYSDCEEEATSEQEDKQNWEWNLDDKRKGVVLGMVADAYRTDLQQAKLRLDNAHVERGYGQRLLSTKGEERNNLLLALYNSL